MRGGRLISLILAASMILAGCSTAPRRFDPHLVASGGDQAAVETALADCRVQVAAGRTRFGEQVASGGVGVAAGYGAGAVVAPTVILSGSAAAAAATLVLMPVVGVAVGLGVARSIRKGKERKLKAALGACMASKGHEVASWSLAAKRSGPAAAQP